MLKISNSDVQFCSLCDEMGTTWMCLVLSLVWKRADNWVLTSHDRGNYHFCSDDLYGRKSVPCLVSSWSTSNSSHCDSNQLQAYVTWPIPPICCSIFLAFWHHSMEHLQERGSLAGGWITCRRVEHLLEHGTPTGAWITCRSQPHTHTSIIWICKRFKATRGKPRTIGGGSWWVNALPQLWVLSLLWSTGYTAV